MKTLVQVAAAGGIAVGNRLFVLPHQLFQQCDLFGAGILRRHFCGQPFQLDADGADLQIAFYRHVRHADVARRLHRQRLFLYQPQDGIAHRGDAGAQPRRQLADLQPLARLELALDQGIAQQVVDGAAEVVVFQRVQRVGHGGACRKIELGRF
ncbi:hypothetical protein D3C85_1461390 [compost metagenome]